ncbi:hypothetical protein ABPG75_003777 [Micractinium tetrahymenae]
MVRAIKVVPLAEDGLGGAPGAAQPRSFGAGSARRGSGGSGAMGKVPSLVFDLEDLGEGSQHPPARDAAEEASADDVVAKLHALLEPWSEPEYMLLLHVRFAREDAAKRGASLAVPDLADTLRRLGYAVKIRTALGGGSGGACLRSLRHSFLTVSVAGPSGALSYVLDPRFREQFEIAHATPRYARVLAAVGPEVVSSQDRLNKVVELLCSEMARAFAETGTPLPPWRQHAAMLSKWQPRRSEEVDVTAALNNGAGLLGPMGAPAGAGGARRLTGPSTVAQRLMMLGVAQQQSNPSPIAEGMEHGSAEEDGWGSVGVPASATSSASSLHLDWDEEAAASDGALPLPPLPPTAQRATPGPTPGAPVAVPQRTVSGPVQAAAGARGKAIYEGMRAVAAALPHRRNNTWAG